MVLDYYPFGLKHKGYNDVIVNANVALNWKFGGKEYQEEMDLSWYDITARNYDPALGRWMNLDPLAEQMRRHSPYNYGFDNPIYFMDPDGLAPEGAIDSYGNSLENCSCSFTGDYSGFSVIKNKGKSNDNGLSLLNNATDHLNDKIQEHYDRIGEKNDINSELELKQEEKYRNSRQTRIEKIRAAISDLQDQITILKRTINELTLLKFAIPLGITINDEISRNLAEENGIKKKGQTYFGQTTRNFIIRTDGVMWTKIHELIHVYDAVFLLRDKLYKPKPMKAVKFTNLPGVGSEVRAHRLTYALGGPQINKPNSVLGITHPWFRKNYRKKNE
ncbi:RHS repeat domain-containing protein [uncultured Psychroserpens sp.]|uniref:RHS repeat domain-containing protein n=1 Tax=uncultured Psychroserpens sp. TaxID=255436 RepID=UPI002617B2FB|nr:RHS repeat-associated core domain-containing protein [uncultured Psychroserpens sp.]